MASPVRAKRVSFSLASPDPHRRPPPLSATALKIQAVLDRGSFLWKGVPYPLIRFAEGTYQEVYQLGESGLLAKIPKLDRGDPKGLLEEQLAFYTRAQAFFPVAPILNEATAVAEGVLVVEEYRPLIASELTADHQKQIQTLVQECWDKQFPMDIHPSNFGFDKEGAIALLDYGPGIEKGDEHKADEWTVWQSTVRNEFGDRFLSSIKSRRTGDEEPKASGDSPD